MQIVGGYEQLLAMPMPALNEVLWYLEWKQKQEEKQLNKSKRK